MRKLIALAVVALVAASTIVVLTAGTGGAGNGIGFGHNLSVRKVVDGTATGPFVVTVTCESEGTESWDLPFLPTGEPDPAAPVEVTDDWNINDGHWIRATLTLDNEFCDIEETVNGGASSTFHQCEYVPATDIVNDVSARRGGRGRTATAVAAYGAGPGCGPDGPDGVSVQFILPAGCLNGRDLVVPEATPLQLEPPLLCRDQALVTVTNVFPAAAVVTAPAFTG